MKASELLERYMNDERQAVQGPLTYAEALHFSELYEKLLISLKEMIDGYVPDTKAEQGKYLNACAAIVEAERGL